MACKRCKGSGVIARPYIDGVVSNNTLCDCPAADRLVTQLLRDPEPGQSGEKVSSVEQGDG